MNAPHRQTHGLSDENRRSRASLPVNGADVFTGSAGCATRYLTRTCFPTAFTFEKSRAQLASKPMTYGFVLSVASATFGGHRSEDLRSACGSPILLAVSESSPRK
jgi:hypothetical protein